MPQGTLPVSSKALPGAGAPLPGPRCPSLLRPPQTWLQELLPRTVSVSGGLRMPRSCPQRTCACQGKVNSSKLRGQPSDCAVGEDRTRFGVLPPSRTPFSPTPAPGPGSLLSPQEQVPEPGDAHGRDTFPSELGESRLSHGSLCGQLRVPGPLLPASPTECCGLWAPCPLCKGSPPLSAPLALQTGLGGSGAMGGDSDPPPVPPHAAPPAPPPL